jgi:hypothetical protein
MKTGKWPAWVLAAALVLLLGTACGKRGAATGTPAVQILPVAEAKDEGGWPLYEVPAEGFALALPPDWRRIDMDPKTFEASFNGVLAQNPQLGAMLGNLRQQMASGVKFFGLDEATFGTGFATNVNVVRVPLPPGGNLDAAVADTVKQLEGLPNVVKPVTRERLPAAGGRERLRFKMTMNVPTGRSATLAVTQYLAVRDKDGYAVTLTTVADQEAKYAATFEKVGQSFRFTK